MARIVSLTASYLDRDVEVEVFTTDDLILLVAPDAEGVLTLWHYADEFDMAPEAIASAYADHPLVWARATSGVPRLLDHMV